MDGASPMLWLQAHTLLGSAGMLTLISASDTLASFVP